MHSIHALDAVVPAGVRVMDLPGRTLLPGLFDLHTHVAVAGGSMTSMLQVDARDNLRSQLYCGVTNVVDLHGDERTIFRLREESLAARDMARLHVAGGAFTVEGGHCTQFPIPANTVGSVAEVDERFDALLPKKPNVIKAVIEHGGWGDTPSMPTLDAERLAAIAQRAKLARLPLFCHIFSAEEALMAVRAGANALVHGIFLGEATTDLTELMRVRGTAYVPTLAVVIGGARAARGEQLYDSGLAQRALHPEVFSDVSRAGGAHWAAPQGSDVATGEGGDVGGGDKQHFANLLRLYEGGVRVGTGTDAGNPLTPHGPALLRELELYVEAGLTPGQALTAATLESAHILGLDGYFGTLEPGKLADVVAVRGLPHEDIADIWNIDMVLRAGVPVDRKAIASRFDKQREERDAELGTGDGPRMAGKVMDPQLDGFDDGDLVSDWGGKWSAQTDEFAGGKSTAALAVLDGNLKLSGNVREGFDWGAWAGLQLSWSPKDRGTIDAASFAGFEMRLRGTPRPYTFTVQRAAVRDFNVFSSILEVEEQWTLVRVPFRRLRQIGFGNPVPWAANDLTGLAVDARNIAAAGEDKFGPFELEVDWIRLYTDE